MNLRRRLTVLEDKLTVKSRCKSCLIAGWRVIYPDEPESEPEPCDECGALPTVFRVVYEDPMD